MGYRRDVLVGRHEGKGPYGRRRSKREGNIKKDFEEVGWGGMGWIDNS
jgi:hypothetical protein